MVPRGGKIRFKNSVEWVQQDEDGEYELSPHFIPNVFVESIDASGTDLLYEGLGSMGMYFFLLSCGFMTERNK